jgi:hypothetical protein
MPHRVFSGPHRSTIHDVSICQDGETFLSVDDLQVFWWHLESDESSSRATCIADVTPSSGNMDDVSQLITSAAFHPSHGSLYLLGRSNGEINIGDLRDPPCRKPRRFDVTMQLRPCHNSVQHPEHNDILTSISSAQFLGDHTVVTRDYLELKLWDTRNPSNGPVAKQGVLTGVAPQLNDLYDCDAIFDRFHVSCDPQSGTVVSGAYAGVFVAWRPFRNDFAAFRVPYHPNVKKDGALSQDDLHLLYSGEKLSTDERNAKLSIVSVAPGGSRICCTMAEHVYLFQSSDYL